MQLEVEFIIIPFCNPGFFSIQTWHFDSPIKKGSKPTFLARNSFDIMTDFFIRYFIWLFDCLFETKIDNIELFFCIKKN